MTLKFADLNQEMIKANLDYQKSPRVFESLARGEIAQKLNLIKVSTLNSQGKESLFVSIP